MTMISDQISVRGQFYTVPAIEIDGHRIVVTGRFLKIARLKEEWYEDVEDPESIIRQLKESHLKADLFTFWQRLPDTEPKYDYHTEWNYIAVLPIHGYDHWWKKQIRSRTRGLIRKAWKKGIVVRESEFDDAFVRGMTSIFNETPIRQGKRFWHYGKDTETVRREFSRCLFREKIVGAYLDDELIGFIFLADAGRFAVPGQILSRVEHRDKSPNNALIAGAVEICAKKGTPFLVYLYWNDGSLAEFKRRNGFERTAVPRYFCPLTSKGKGALKLHLQSGWIGVLPRGVRQVLWEWLRRARRILRSGGLRGGG